MTGSEIISFANSLLDESNLIGEVLGLDLANYIKDLIEQRRQWNFLIKRDTSISITSSTDWETANGLPSDFREIIKDGVVIGRDGEDSYSKVYPVAFKKRELYKDTNKYCIDYANNNIYFLDDFDDNYTAYIYYIYETDDLTANTEPVWKDKYHRIISFLMAEIHASGIDYDEIQVNKAIAQNKQANLLYRMMKDWDVKIDMNNIGYSTPIEQDPNSLRTNRIIR